MSANIFKYIAGAVVPILVGWGITHTLIVSNRARPSFEVSKFPKGKQGAIEQSHALLDALRANDWDYSRVPDNLKGLPMSAPQPIRECCEGRHSFSNQDTKTSMLSSHSFLQPLCVGS